MNTGSKIDQILVLLLGLFFALSAPCTWAAKAPLTSKKLEKEASHIVSGQIVEVTSKIQKSLIKKGLGIHRDRVFTIKIKVKIISKGAGVKVDDQIDVIAWQPSTRIPPIPGLQGHELIPKKGEVVKFYLRSKKGKFFEPLLPNGIAVKKDGA